MSGKHPGDDAVGEFGGESAPAVSRPGLSQAPAAAEAVRRPNVPPKLYRIGEVVEYSGVSRQTVHNYTIMGLLREARWTPGGHRLYDEGVFERLERISRLKSQHRTLEEIREDFARRDGRAGSTETVPGTDET